MATINYCSDKDVNTFIAKLVREQGWLFTKGKKHGKLTAPNGRMVTYSVSPSCPFVLHKIRKDCDRVMALS